MVTANLGDKSSLNHWHKSILIAHYGAILKEEATEVLDRAALTYNTFWQLLDKTPIN